MEDTTTKSKWGAILAFIISNWSWILLILGSLGGIIGFTNYQAAKKTISELSQAKEWTDSVSSAQIKFYKDQAGKEHARAENLVVHDQAMEMLADSAAKALKVKADQVTTLTNEMTKTYVSVTPIVDTISIGYINVPCKGDSVKSIVSLPFEFNDPWVDISGQVGIKGLNHIDFLLRDSLKQATYWKRKWLLGPKTYYTDITHTNPYIQTEGYRGLSLSQVSSDATKWSIGPVIALGYAPGFSLSKPQFFFGVGVQYSIKKF